MTNEETPQENIHLAVPLVDFDGSPWTVRNAVEGVQVFGGIGSGKTTGSGRMLALKYLSHGFGGLVLTVKPDEKALWEKYCAIAGRSNDLVIIEPGGPHRFNFLEYESTRGDTANIVQVLRTVIWASEDKVSGAGHDPFWENALDMLIAHVIDLCKLADGRVTVQHMYDIVQSLPMQERRESGQDSAFQTAMRKAREKVAAKEQAWKANQPPDLLAQWVRERTYDEALFNAEPDARLLYFVDQFFSKTFYRLAEKTRSIIDFSFSGFLFRLLREPVYSLFCRHESNVTPEDCLQGKIILIDLPVKIHHKVGQECQVMFKYIWQRAMEKRDVGRDGLPLFLWADEAQNFLHEYDAEYQATARSSMISTVYLSQNLPNYHANMGGAKSEYRVKSFLGTLATKIFHANADIETNRYASELIGDGFFKDMSRTTSMAGEFSASRSENLKIDRIVRPEDFPLLKTGGKHNGYLTGTYVHFQGNVLDSGESFTPIQFDQTYTPSTENTP